MYIIHVTCVLEKDPVHVVEIFRGENVLRGEWGCMGFPKIKGRKLELQGGRCCMLILLVFLCPCPPSSRTLSTNIPAKGSKHCTQMV